jgi:hypothetical protein
MKSKENNLLHVKLRFSHGVTWMGSKRLRRMLILMHQCSSIWHIKMPLSFMMCSYRDMRVCSGDGTSWRAWLKSEYMRWRCWPYWRKQLSEGIELSLANSSWPCDLSQLVSRSVLQQLMPWSHSVSAWAVFFALVAGAADQLMK